MLRPRTVILKEVDEGIKHQIVETIESGKMSQMQAAREYGFSRAAICKWLKQYGKLRIKTQIVKIVMKEEKEKIKELSEALGDAHLKIRYYEKLLELASKECGKDLKKNLATKASEALSKKETKSKDCVGS